jgi:hypothetical protein
MLARRGRPDCARNTLEDWEDFKMVESMVVNGVPGLVDCVVKEDKSIWMDGWMEQ